MLGCADLACFAQSLIRAGGVWCWCSGEYVNPILYGSLSSIFSVYRFVSFYLVCRGCTYTILFLYNSCLFCSSRSSDCEWMVERRNMNSCSIALIRFATVACFGCSCFRCVAVLRRATRDSRTAPKIRSDLVSHPIRRFTSNFRSA